MMRKYCKWVHLLVLTAFLVSAMPFASHAMMLHAEQQKTMLPDDTANHVDCARHHQAGAPDLQHDTSDMQQCECLTTGCYNTALQELSCNILSVYIAAMDFPRINPMHRSAVRSRLERPPRA
jgi:hypothetical protein